MLSSHLLQQVNHWLPTWGRASQDAAEPTSTAVTRQLQLQPGDFYFLDAGSYQVRVLAGEIWIPEHGIFAAGEQVHLLPDRQGLSLRTADDRPAVFTVCTE
jgi:hypothetical protein